VKNEAAAPDMGIRLILSELILLKWIKGTVVLSIFDLHEIIVSRK
jgi:hypothetical protein